jgi:hypothetical protein
MDGTAIQPEERPSIADFFRNWEDDDMSRFLENEGGLLDDLLPDLPPEVEEEEPYVPHHFLLSSRMM